MSVETDMYLQTEELCQKALNAGRDQQAVLRAGQYVIAQIRRGMCPNKVAVGLIWAAFADGWTSRAKLEGVHGN